MTNEKPVNITKFLEYKKTEPKIKLRVGSDSRGRFVYTMVFKNNAVTVEFVKFLIDVIGGIHGQKRI